MPREGNRKLRLRRAPFDAAIVETAWEQSLRRADVGLRSCAQLQRSAHGSERAARTARLQRPRRILQSRLIALKERHDRCERWRAATMPLVDERLSMGRGVAIDCRTAAIAGDGTACVVADGSRGPPANSAPVPTIQRSQTCLAYCADGPQTRPATASPATCRRGEDLRDAAGGGCNPGNGSGQAKCRRGSAKAASRLRSVSGLSAPRPLVCDALGVRAPVRPNRRVRSLPKKRRRRLTRSHRNPRRTGPTTRRTSPRCGQSCWRTPES